MIEENISKLVGNLIDCLIKVYFLVRISQLEYANAALLVALQ